MAIIVSMLGVVIALIGVFMLANPRGFVRLLGSWQGASRYSFAVGIRVVLGGVFVVVAPDCHAPMVVRLVGVISIVAALGILVLGRVRLDAFIEWWLRHPAVLRVSSSGAIAFGALLVYAGPR